jgi:hypothetical protein
MSPLRILAVLAGQRRSVAFLQVRWGKPGQLPLIIVGLFLSLCPQRVLNTPCEDDNGGGSGLSRRLGGGVRSRPQRIALPSRSGPAGRPRSRRWSAGRGRRAGTRDVRHTGLLVADDRHVAAAGRGQRLCLGDGGQSLCNDSHEPRACKQRIRSSQPFQTPRSAGLSVGCARGWQVRATCRYLQAGRPLGRRLPVPPYPRWPPRTAPSCYPTYLRVRRWGWAACPPR